MIEQLPIEYHNNAQLVAAWERFAIRHQEAGAAIANKLSASSEEIPIRLADGELVGSVIASEYAERYALVRWSILSFETGNDGLGATINRFEGDGVDRRWAGAEARILPNGLLAFDAHGARGLTYLALHETAHTTPLGITMNNDCWNQHRTRKSGIPWGQTNPWWLRNEKTANNISRNVAARLDLPILHNPGAQFDDMQGDRDLIFLEAISLVEGSGRH